MDKNIWKPLLVEMGFSEEKHEVLLDYIQRHMEYEKIIGVTLNTTLHLEQIPTLAPALKVLSRLDFDKICFIDSPFLECKHGEFHKPATYGVSYTINQEELMVIDDIETEILMHLVNDTVEQLNKKLENEYLYVYVLFSGLRKHNNQILAAHRYFTSEYDMKFKIPHVCYYLKQVGEVENGELKLELATRLIPEEKKDSFLTYIKEIGNSLPSEDELRSWCEKEEIVL